MTRPQPSEAAPYYSNYIDLVTSDDIVSAIYAQKDETVQLLERISEEKSLYAYAPGKWTIRQMLSHINDGERVFLNRAFWFARGFQDPLPSFDQDVAVQFGQANQISWAQHVAEFRTVRWATITFFQNMPEEAWSRTGVASDNPFTVRALAYIIAGHVAHHTNVLREKYGIS